jgi:hypothetical protein
MPKKNCWEVKNCGRQKGGIKVAEFGVCPAAIETRTEGINGGKTGGRACWAISGTLCGGKVQGVYAEKVGNCMKCEFYQSVRTEEGAGFASSQVIMDKLG